MGAGQTPSKHSPARRVTPSRPTVSITRTKRAQLPQRLTRDEGSVTPPTLACPPPRGRSRRGTMHSRSALLAAQKNDTAEEERRQRGENVRSHRAESYRARRAARHPALVAGDGVARWGGRRGACAAARRAPSGPITFAGSVSASARARAGFVIDVACVPE